MIGPTSAIVTGQGGTANAANSAYTYLGAAQTITFTSTPPTNGAVGGATYSVAATGGASGNPVAFSIDAASSGVCSISGGVVTFAAPGICTIDANQAGNSSYAAASQVQQSITVGSQTLSFTSTAPSAAVVSGATYTPAGQSVISGTSTSTGLTPVLTVDASSSGVCTITAGVVSFKGAGTCILNANQSGNASYSAASQVQQIFSVGKGSQTITFGA